MKILICDKLDKITIEELQKLGTCIDVSQDKDKSKKIKENIIDTEIVLVRSDTQINKELLDVSKKLKRICQKLKKLLITLINWNPFLKALIDYQKLFLY